MVEALARAAAVDVGVAARFVGVFAFAVDCGGPCGCTLLAAAERRPAADAGELERVEDGLERPEASDSFLTEMGRREVGDVGDCGMSDMEVGGRVGGLLFCVVRREGGGLDGGGGRTAKAFCWLCWY